MARRQRECYLCGESYQYCSTCSQDRMKPAWMSEFHSESCKNIFDICTRYNMGMMSKEESQVALSACDLSNKENFKACVKRDLDVIFAEETKKRGKKAAMNTDDEATAIVEDITHEVVKEEN